MAVADGVGWTAGLVVPDWCRRSRARTACLGPLAIVFITASFVVLLGAKRMRVVPIETLEVTDELSLLEPPVPRADASRANRHGLRYRPGVEAAAEQPSFATRQLLWRAPLPRAATGTSSSRTPSANASGDHERYHRWSARRHVCNSGREASRSSRSTTATMVGMDRMMVSEVSSFITRFRLFEITEVNASIMPVRMSV